MEYEKQTHVAFINRTLQLLTQYQTLIRGKVPKSEQYEVTLLINCLLGLLIVPNERCFSNIPVLQLKDLKDWGILPEYLQDSTTQVLNLRQLVRCLRNTTAHGGVTPIGNGSEITALSFEDENGFKATIPVGQLEHFALTLASAVNE